MSVSFHKAQESACAFHSRSQGLDAGAEASVGGVDDSIVPLRQGAKEGDDVVVRGVGTAARCELHAQGRALADPRRAIPWRSAIEDNRPSPARAPGDLFELRDDPPLRRPPVAPPAVGPRAHEVVAVDEDVSVSHRGPGRGVGRVFREPGEG